MVRDYFVTAKGSTFPIRNLKGKEYLEVAYRVAWCREDHPGWSFNTEFVHISDKYALAKATIKNEDDKILATAHKREDEAHFKDFAEKAETGALGRALAYCGYGTQFAADLEEGVRIVDAPLGQDNDAAHADNEPPPPPTLNNPGEYVVEFGNKIRGKRLKDVPRVDLENYLKWVQTEAKRPLSQSALSFAAHAGDYLDSLS